MLIRNTLLYLPAQVIGPAMQFVAIVIFTHWMDPEAYGVFTYVIATQEFVFLLCVAWWSQYTVRYFGEHAMSADDRYRNSEGMILAATSLAQVASTILALKLLSSPMTPGLIGAAIFCTVTRCFTLHLGERARAQNLILDYTIAATVGPLVGFVVAFLAVAEIAPTPAAALAGYGMVQTLSVMILAARQGVVMRLALPDRDLLRQALAFGLPLIAAGVAGWCGMNIIRVMVDWRDGAAAMGLIAVGWSLGHRVASTVAMLMTVAAFPLAVESFRLGSREEAFREITRNGLLMCGLLLPAAVGLNLVRETLIPLLVAKAFQPMTVAILPAALVAGVARNLRTHIADQIFVLMERTPIVFVMTALEAALVAAGCAIGVLHGDAWGAAVGSAVGYVVAMLIGFAVVRRRTGLWIPMGGVGGIMIATAIMAAAVILLRPLSEPPGVELAGVGVSVALGAAIYALAILVVFPEVARYACTRWKRVQPLFSWKKS